MGASFDCHGWSGEVPKLIEDRLKDLEFKAPLENLRVMLIPTEGDLAGWRRFGMRIAATL